MRSKYLLRNKKKHHPVRSEEETNSNSQQHEVVTDSIALAKQAIINLTHEGIYKTPVCRDEEMEEIEKFLMKGIREGGSSQTLYIAGLSGIGKTLTVRSVIERLRSNPKYSKTFDSWYFNAMNLKTPFHIYKALLTEIFDTKHQDTLYKLNKLLTETSSHGEKVRIVVIDEIDYLLTKNQDVLYNLFEWTHHPNSKLVLIGIANTMEMPATLNTKTSSRMGERRIIFKAYNREQISHIIDLKLKEIKIFAPEALRYACIKMSKFSTDIRKIVHLISQSLRVFIDKNDSQLVSSDHIMVAFDQFVKSKPQNVYIGTMHSNFQLVLVMVMIETQLHFKRYCLLSRVAVRVYNNNKELSLEAVTSIIKQLQEVKILRLAYRTELNSAQTLIYPIVEADDVRNSIHNPELESLLSQI